MIYNEILEFNAIFKDYLENSLFSIIVKVHLMFNILILHYNNFIFLFIKCLIKQSELKNRFTVWIKFKQHKDCKSNIDFNLNWNL